VADRRAAVDAVPELRRVSSGSTGGGIKMVRTLVTFQQALREMSKQIHPAMMQSVRLGRHVIETASCSLSSRSCCCTSRRWWASRSCCWRPGSSRCRVVGDPRHHQQCRPRAQRGRTGRQLLAAHGLSDLGVQFLDAAGRLELFTLFVLFTPRFWRK